MAYYIERKQYHTAGTLDSHMYRMLTEEWGPGLNFNNINQFSPYPDLEKLSWKINAFVKPTLPVVNQNLQWNYICDTAFENLKNHFLVSTTKFCMYLSYRNSTVFIIVYTRFLNFDLSYFSRDDPESN